VIQESLAVQTRAEINPWTDERAGLGCTLKVASYNIHRCIGTDGKYNPDRIAAVIRHLNPDLIGLQEVDDRVPAGGGMFQLKYLASRLNYRAIAGPCITGHNGHYGNALLTRLPIIDHRLIDLSVKGREPRGALDLDLVMGEHLLRVIVTHLGCRAFERRKQIVKLLGLIARGEKRPTVIMGDFNEWSRHGRGIRRINFHFGLTSDRPTFPSILPIFPLDRIWALGASKRPDFHIEKSPLTRAASDHLPVSAVIKF